MEIIKNMNSKKATYYNYSTGIAFVINLHKSYNLNFFSFLIKATLRRNSVILIHDIIHDILTR